MVQIPAESYPRYSRRFSPSNRRWATSLFPTIPTIPHMVLLGRFPGHALAEAASPAGDTLLLAALQGEAVRLDVTSDHRPCADDGAVADGNRRDQGRVRTDEGARADYRPVLA